MNARAPMNIKKEKEEMSVKKPIVILILLIVLMIQAAIVSALTNGPLQVQVKYGNNVAVWSYIWDNNNSTYTLTSPLDLAIDGQTVARLESLTCGITGDPTLFLDFSVHAFVPLNITFDTGILAFAAITDPTAFATAGVSLTGDSDGGTATGNFGGLIYEATYNGGAVFTDLLPTFNVGPNETVTESGRTPAIGTSVIAGSVDSMRAQFSFMLDEGESLSGTSRYEIEPIPDANTLVLAFCGCIPTLAMFAIRKRKYS